MRIAALAGMASIALSSAVPSMADVRPVKLAPKSIVADHWAGGYVGVNAGIALGRSKDRWDEINSPPFSVAAPTVVPATANATLRDNGFIGGGQIGYNWQRSRFVYGVEADIQYTGLSKTRTAVSAETLQIVPGLISESFRSNILSTVRGKIGYTPVDNWLIYATGGLAIAKVEYADELCFTTAFLATCNTASSRSWRAGWAAGAGVEWKWWSAWSVKLEYMHIEVDRNYPSVAVLTVFLPGLVIPNSSIQHHRSLSEDIVRVGLNYKLGVIR